MDCIVGEVCVLVRDEYGLHSTKYNLFDIVTHD